MLEVRHGAGGKRNEHHRAARQCIVEEPLGLVEFRWARQKADLFEIRALHRSDRHQVADALVVAAVGTLA